MVKVMFALTAFLMSSTVFAATITADNIIGKYLVVASVPFQKVKINFRVLSNKDFEIEQLNHDGSPEETCNGTYEIQSAETLFKGVFNCPSNRSKDVDFDIDFKGKTTDDLVAGTSVTVTTSLAPTKIKATVIRVK
jgi:hypothetical protein